MLTVALVTSHADDNLTDADYRDIYGELRVGISLDAFVARIHSSYSKAYWSKWSRNPDLALTRQARNELRSGVNLPVLPATVAEAVDQTDPNATVYRVGQSRPTRIVMVGGDVPSVILRLNGHLHVVADATAENVRVTPVTRPRSRSNYAGLSMSRDTRNRLNAIRVRTGQTWENFLAHWARLLEDAGNLA